MSSSHANRACSLWPAAQDVGGEDSQISDALLALVDYVAPNESELARLTGLPADTDAQVLAAAAALQRRGARGVLATLGSRGSLLVAPDGAVLRQSTLSVPGAGVVDATAAGDAFRAAFAVALVEGRPMQDCLRFASAAGGIAVSRLGAVPSLPTRAEVEALLASTSSSGGGGGGDGRVSSTSDHTDKVEAAVPGSSLGQGSTGSASHAAACGASSCSSSDNGGQPAPAPVAATKQPPACPRQFAARLNSMRARRSDGGDDLPNLLARQARVPGLTHVVLNHPSHTAGRSPAELKALLGSTDLQLAALALRFPAERFALGAFTQPHAASRQQALDLATEACRLAAELGAPDVVVWPQYDGYDYAFQVGTAGLPSLIGGLVPARLPPPKGAPA
jgi:hypothetical protein